MGRPLRPGGGWGEVNGSEDEDHAVLDLLQPVRA